MTELPASYRKYLEGRTRDFIETVRPVFLQSVAEAEHGVRVILNEPHTLQALIDDRIPYGEVVEDVD